jgi:predicted phosphodiesterase
VADIYAIGHTHHRIAFSKEMGTADGPKRIVMLNVGSLMAPYQNDFGGYAVQKMYPPQDIGPIVVDLFPEERMIRVY